MTDHGERGAQAENQVEDGAPPGADYDTLKMIWDELRAERANQYSRNASISIVATALLGFEGVLITRVPDLRVQTGCRIASMVFMALSIAGLLDCLLDMPGRGDRDWRRHSKRALAAMLPTDLRNEVEPLPAAAAVHRLITRSQQMIEDNHNMLLTRRRFILHAAVVLFAIALALLGVGALYDWTDSWHPIKITYWPPFWVSFERA
ncbi:hypothetical protein OG342_08910 [Streptomyces bobili]|uniref:hypothetical protein n=1 Tax=Streptomyces bobili TaxID=67280 RepID=UPI0022518E35|nr:hypothetical protein [Streptomyces bobili]MCX5522980.1 hypothetical protein [Streptomyces bobili]